MKAFWYALLLILLVYSALCLAQWKGGIGRYFQRVGSFANRQWVGKVEISARSLSHAMLLEVAGTSKAVPDAMTARIRWKREGTVDWADSCVEMTNSDWRSIASFASNESAYVYLLTVFSDIAAGGAYDVSITLDKDVPGMGLWWTMLMRKCDVEGKDQLSYGDVTNLMKRTAGEN